MKTPFSQAKKLQKKLSKQIIKKNSFNSKIQKVCGVDVSYKENLAFASAVILDKNSLEVINHADYMQSISSPYIPGLFMLRESKPILGVLARLQFDFQLLFVDGHGILHPQKCGLASYIGLKINKPTIGVAKKLLCGLVKVDGKVLFEGENLGRQLIYDKKKVYVSVGNMVNLRTAVKLVKELTLDGEWYPEPLRLADKYSKEFRKKILKN